MSNFIPEQPKTAENVPFFDDLPTNAGWNGQTTTKSIETLQSEVVQAVSRLGGMVVGFQKGVFLVGENKRDGYRVSYIIHVGEKTIPGRIDIAALPVKEFISGRAASVEIRREKSLKMALFMLRDAFDGMWFLQQLSPGFAPLMPFMLAEGDKTITQLWSENNAMANLLPSGDGEFIDGQYSESK